MEHPFIECSVLSSLKEGGEQEVEEEILVADELGESHPPLATPSKLVISTSWLYENKSEWKREHKNRQENHSPTVPQRTPIKEQHSTSLVPTRLRVSTKWLTPHKTKIKY